MSFGKCPSNFMSLVSPNDKKFYSYFGTSVGSSQMKIFSLLIIETFLFETLFFHKNLKHVYFFY